MEQDFPYRLDPGASAPVVFDRVPGQPDERRFGYVVDGLATPPGNGYYVVEFDPADAARVRVLAFGDTWGRLFAVDEPQTMPPACYPTCQLFAWRESPGEGAIETFDERGARRLLADVTCSGQTIHARVSVQRLEADVPGDTSPLFGEKSVAEALAMAYLAFFEARGGGFSLGVVYDRLGGGDLCDAVNREVLEAQAGWAEHPEGATGIERHLVHLLLESGAVGHVDDDFEADESLPGAAIGLPTARLIRTMDYADTYYADFCYVDDEGSTVDNGGFAADPRAALGRRTMLAAESALNRFLLAARLLERRPGGAVGAAQGACAEADAQVIERVCDQAEPVLAPSDETGRWAMLRSFGQRLELLAVPYRFVCNYTANRESTALGATVLCPPADRMPRTRWDDAARDYAPLPDADRARTAARYAAHEALLALRMGFASAPHVMRVCVNVELDGDAAAGSGADAARPCLISADIARPAFERALHTEDDHAFPDPFATLQRLGARFSLEEDGRLRAIEPLFDHARGEFAPGFAANVKDDDAPFGARAQFLLGVGSPRELSIFEEGERVTASNAVLAAMDAGEDAAVAALREVRDATENLPLRDLCERLIDGFAAGTLDAQSYLEVREAFNDAYGFHAPMTYAYRLIGDDEEDKAVPVLEGLLAQTQALTGFADDDAVCYRYFDSYATRAIYADKCDLDAQGRQVRQLPDEAFLVHDALAQVLTRSAGDFDGEALQHARTCIRLAPARAQSYLRAARVHFMRNEFAEEAQLCRQALEFAWNPEDASLALYWLAFAYWQMGQPDLAAACYRRCLLTGGSMAGSAAEELSELTDEVKGLQRRSPDGDEAVLLAAGVPVNALIDNARFLLEAAQAAVDDGAVALGAVLTLAAQRTMRDDALSPLLRSLDTMTRKEPDR